jgi:CrcB protein
MIKLLAIGAGGALGAILRYVLSNGTHMVLGRGFPYGTLFVNVVGCLAMGILYVLFLEKWSVGAEWRAAIQVGLLGALTTYSTFSIETLMLFESGEAYKAVINVIVSVVFCLLAAGLGLVLGRQL